MPAPEPAGTSPDRRGPPDVAALIPIVRRIVAARVPDQATADDLVQETLARVLAAVDRIEPGMLEPYAIVTARNVVASMWRARDRQQRHQHPGVDPRPSPSPGEDGLPRGGPAGMAAGLTPPSGRERRALPAPQGPRPGTPAPAPGP